MPTMKNGSSVQTVKDTTKMPTEEKNSVAESIGDVIFGLRQ